MTSRHPRGFGWLIAAQFASALADNALLIVAIAHLQFRGAPGWWAPLLKFSFTLAYVLLAPFIGALADTVCKRALMGWMNALKALGLITFFLGWHPLLSFAIVGLGASAYAPAKYGLLTESVHPRFLVAANGWVESAVVLSVLLGTVLGGGLVSAWWLDSTVVQGLAESRLLQWGQSSPALNVSLCSVLCFYGLSALFNLGIVPSGTRYEARSWSIAALFLEFRRCNRGLWRDPLGGTSLAVTTAFWGMSAMLQFAILRWATETLGLQLSQAAYLQGLGAIGVIAGAVIAARRIGLRHALHVLPLGLAMGVVVLMCAWITNWPIAVPAALIIGALGGLLVVPMNALLQHRGHRLLSAGQSIAVQGFNENAMVVVMLAIYAAFTWLNVPASLVMAAAGLALISFTTIMLLRRWESGRHSAR